MGATGNNVSGDRKVQHPKSVDIAVHDMWAHLKDLPRNVVNNHKDAVDLIKSVKQKPLATITIYEGTSNTNIRHGDFVFLDEKEAERMTRGAMGRGKKPGFRVIQKQVTADEVEWTKRGFQFRYK